MAANNQEAVGIGFINLDNSCDIVLAYLQSIVAFVIIKLKV